MEFSFQNKEKFGGVSTYFLPGHVHHCCKFASFQFREEQQSHLQKVCDERLVKELHFKMVISLS